MKNQLIFGSMLVFLRSKKPKDAQKNKVRNSPSNGKTQLSFWMFDEGYVKAKMKMVIGNHGNDEIQSGDDQYIRQLCIC